MAAFILISFFIGVLFTPSCFSQYYSAFSRNEYRPVEYKTNPAPDNHRCGICPTYLQKMCAFNPKDNTTFIFDNHCVMDLYNCMEGTAFIRMNYEQCLYFGNFGYVHGYKYEDLDYEESRIIIKNTKKNPDFI